MKKQFGLPLMLASVLAFSACSSEDVPSNGALTDFSNGGYVKMAINLPTKSDNGFKSPNDEFGDGKTEEYTVNNGTLILFQGNNENDAMFHSAYTLDVSNQQTPYTQQITKVLQLTKPVKGDGIGTNLYALVILNDNDIVKVQADHSLKVKTSGGDVDFSDSFAKFKEFTATSNSVKTNDFVSTAGGFFMTNAPLANKVGGGTDPSDATINTLVNLNGSTYSTEADAMASPAANVYVERGVAKVTFTDDSGVTTTDQEFKDAAGIKTPLSDGAGIANVTYQITGWTLDVTNTSSYLVRHYSSEWNGLNSPFVLTGVLPYRFIGSKDVEEGATLNASVPAPQYRTYWAEDPNYTSADAANFSNLAGSSISVSNAYGENNPQYCFENTFNVENQKQDRTTRVIVRAEVKVNGTAADFYMVNGNKSTLYSETQLKALVQNAIYNDAQVQAVLATAPGVAFNAANINVTYGAVNAANAEMLVDDFSFTFNGTTYTKANTELSSVINNVNSKITNITKYANGVVYYPVRIKHFGDDLTPWASNQAGVDKNNVYTSSFDANKYLGRYGVVRNNWYDLGVRSISGIGSAVVPSREGFDDELNNYIAVRINVLSWAKRSQREDL